MANSEQTLRYVFRVNTYGNEEQVRRSMDDTLCRVLKVKIRKGYTLDRQEANGVMVPLVEDSSVGAYLNQSDDADSPQEGSYEPDGFPDASGDVSPESDAPPES